MLNVIRSSHKLKILNEIIPSTVQSNYTNILCNYTDRSTIAKFRLSAHNLFVETGRYNNTNYFDRLCSCCTLNEVEDELHFLFHCPLYSEGRSLFYLKLNNFYPNFFVLPFT